MSYMFSKCYDLKKINAIRTDFSKVENMEHMFEWCRYLIDVSDTSYWNLENVKTLKALFYECTSLKTIKGMEKWDPIKLETCEEMFLGCYNNLNSSETSKIYKWENVPDYIKKESTKGYSATNIITYAAFDNYKGTLKYVMNNIIPFKKKNKENK